MPTDKEIEAAGNAAPDGLPLKDVVLEEEIIAALEAAEKVRMQNIIQADYIVAGGRRLLGKELREYLEAATKREEKLREALDRQCDNMAFVLNHFKCPNSWFHKFNNELTEDRQALQTEEKPDA